MESMEMAPGAILRPGRVPKQRLLSPELRLRWRRCYGTLFGQTWIDLGFSPWRLYIGGGAMSEGTRGAHTRWWHGQGWTRATRWCGPPPGPPLSLLSTLSHVGENRNFGLCFVQFRGYFMCNFSKTQK
jgi:hypothetical protein